MVRSGKEAYQEEEANLKSARKEESDQHKELLEAAMYEKLPVMSFQTVERLLDFVKGKTSQQIEQRLQRMYDESHGQALELEQQYQILIDNLAQASSTLDKAVRALCDFEQTVLGIGQQGNSEKKDSR